MFRLLTRLVVLVGVMGFVSRAFAFSLLGPYGIEDLGGTVWQVPRIGYNLPGDIGGPMNVTEEYRWNVPVIYYAFDAAFLDFFGTRGVQEIEKAIKIFNDLPPASTLNVDTYPMTAERLNARASALGLMDLKSMALKALTEELGMISPNRYIYCLRNRAILTPARFPVGFNVIRRNFDPVTGGESSYINGRLWDVQAIFDLDNPPWSYTANFPVDPLDQGRFDPVASLFDESTGSITPAFWTGTFFTGLTRDDVGAIKYSYQTANQNFESAPTNAIGSSTFVSGGTSGNPPWGIPLGTNLATTNITIVTNALINPARRFGVDKLTFVRTQFDSLLGQFFTPITNVYTEFVWTNNQIVGQSVQRAVVVPDILFRAGDLQGVPDGNRPSVVYARSTTANWVNDDGLTQAARRSGPGTIPPGVTITFNNTGFLVPFDIFGSPGPVTFLGDLPWYVFGAFDGTTNEPVVFSQGGNITVQQLEDLRLGR